MTLSYGFVVGHFAELVGDRGPSDPDRYPDEVATPGSVTFKPTPTTITDFDPVTGLGTLFTPRNIVANLNAAGQLEDANNLPGVWLIAGIEYTASLSFMSLTAKFVLTAAQTVERPLDLIKQFGLTPDPSTKFVVNEQVYTDTLAAAARAEAAAEAAEGAAGGPAVTSVNDRSGKVVLTKADVALGNVSNLAPADMPISTAQATAFNARAAAGRTISAGAGLTGGGDLTADRTLGLDAATQTAVAAVAPGGRVGRLGRSLDNTNLNDFVDAGWGSGLGMTSGPAGADGYAFVFNLAHAAGSGWLLQKYTEFATSSAGASATRRTWQRQQQGGGWSPWTLLSDSKGARFSPTSNEGTSGDLNAVITNGWTTGSGMANAPTTDFYYVQTQRVADGGLYVVQTAILGGKGAQSGDMYRRFLEGAGGWTTWVRLANYLGAIDQPARDTLATKITKGQQAIVYADVDPAIASAINNGAAAYNALSSKADVSALSAKADVTALSSKADLVNGVVATSQIPALALQTRVPVASQAAMLALTAAQVQPGDLAVRTDVGVNYLLGAADPSVLANWIALDLTSGGAVASVNGLTGAVTLGKADIGLGSVDNTADTAKPVSTAQATALALKAPLASPTFTGTVSGITKAMVGLGSVDNTADTAKPVSTAQATAIALKADLASPTLTGSPTAPTASAGTNTGQLATTAFVMANATIGDAIVATSLSPGSTSTALNASGSRSTRISLTAATTLTLAAGAAGVSYTHTLTLVQDATGGRTITWPTNVKWRGSGTKPTLSTAANAIDLVTLYWSGTEWIGMFAADGAA